jgi:hypothetical protein
MPREQTPVFLHDIDTILLAGLLAGAGWSATWSLLLLPVSAFMIAANIID